MPYRHKLWLLPRKVERSRESAQRENVTDKVEFRIADAQNLPFEDAVFDAVITESVTAFLEDKQKAVCEYARVTRPGGYVGLKVPPPPEIMAWAVDESESRRIFMDRHHYKEPSAEET